MSLEMICACTEKMPQVTCPKDPRILRDYTICPCCKGTGVGKGFLGSITACRVCRGAKVIRL